MILGLIHDCEEDGFMPKDLIAHLFGSFVAEGSEYLSKVYIQTDEAGIIISKKRKSDKEYFENLAKADIRIRHVKIADRIDNLRSMESVWTKEKQKEYIEETIRYILPLGVGSCGLSRQLRDKVKEWCKQNQELFVQ